MPSGTYPSFKPRSMTCAPGTRWWCGNWTGWPASLKQLIETVEGLEQRGIGFCSLTEAIDTTTAGGKLTFHIFAALAAFERSIIRERTRAGLDAARARGRTGGRPPALAEKDLQQARALLRDADITMAEVARRLGVAPGTLYRHLPGGRGGVGI